MGLFAALLQRLRVNSYGYYGYTAESPRWLREAYEQETVRAIVDCIASHTARAQAMHVIMDKDGRIREIKRSSPYAKLLNQQPNELMSGYDLKYKIIAQLETKTTAMVYIKWDGLTPRSMIPINYQDFEICPVHGGGYAVAFDDDEGTGQVLPLEDVVLVRKFFCNRDVAGDGNEPIRNTLNMVAASDSGFIEALSVSNKVRGLYKQKKAMLDPEDVKKGQSEFSARFAAAAKGGGVVGVDSMEEYVPLNVTAYSANAAQMAAVRDNLYAYWRTDEAIVKSTYTEQQGQAWYESVIEPHWQRLSEAFTNACFTPHERECGNRILFSGTALMGTSYQTRVNLITNTKETGLLSVNEQRELLGYPPVEGGDERQVSLNYVKASDQSKYQTGQDEPVTKDKTD